MKLDLTGLKCPLPAMKTKKAMKTLPEGDTLQITCTDPDTLTDIPALARTMGWNYAVVSSADGKYFYFELSKGVKDVQTA